jgi:hypothetical protein
MVASAQAVLFSVSEHNSKGMLAIALRSIQQHSQTKGRQELVEEKLKNNTA